MLIESIKLENFRQFQNESITFADGSDGKNVTIILGENGSGKTTFAQAFFGVCTVKRLSPTSGCSIPKLPAR